MSMEVTFADLLSRKVKLEFGNQAQILAIDREKEFRDRDAEMEEAGIQKDNPNIKKIWRLTYSISGETVVEVEAFTSEEAQMLGKCEINVFDADLDFDLLEIDAVAIEKKNK